MMLKNLIKEYLIEEGKIVVYIKKNGKVDYSKPVYDVNSKPHYLKNINDISILAGKRSGIYISNKLKSLSNVPQQGYYDVDYNMINDITTLRPSEKF